MPDEVDQSDGTVDEPEATQQPPDANGASSDSPSATREGAGQDGGVEGLLALVKERGFVTTGEIFAAFPGLEPETSELAAIWTLPGLIPVTTPASFTRE